MNLRTPLRDATNKIANRFGLEVRHYGTNILPEALPEPEAYAGPEDFSKLYRPWRSAKASDYLTAEVMANTMLSPQKLYFLTKMLEGTLALEGDVFEAGTGSGGSSKLMLNAQKKHRTKKTMWLLDTFEGYQKVDRDRDGAHVELNQCRCASFEDVKALLTDEEVTCHLIKGLIPATLAEVRTEKLCFAHIDVNLHEPTDAATEFCLKRMTPGGVIVFDDYCWPLTYGAKSAIDEVCAKYGQQVVALPESTQAFLIKR